MSLYVGTISGTSVDALDIALLHVDESRTLEIVDGVEVPFPTHLQRELQELAWPGENEVERVGIASVQLGRFTGNAVLEFLHTKGVQASDVSAIGSHGQTIRHRVDRTHPFTVQIGDPNQIAELSGIPVIADFRGRDVAAGGQGAPLVPIFHNALFRLPDQTRIVLNIGGIANITVLPPKNTNKPVLGYDTGPGNSLMDAWIQATCGKPYDANGGWANSGDINEQLLALMLEHPYFSRPYPKSTGKETFNLEYVQQATKQFPTARTQDIQRTLLELTTRSISEQLHQHDATEVVLCGGGAKNRLLRSRLADFSSGKYQVVSCDEIGTNGDAIEAATFAYLAYCFMARLPGNLPEVTGASKRRVLGCLYPA